MLSRKPQVAVASAFRRKAVPAVSYGDLSEEFRDMARSGTSKQPSLKRRKFLQQGALAGAAALVGPPAIAGAQTPASVPNAAAPVAGVTPVMTAAQEATAPDEVQVLGSNERCGSDYMVDVLKS